MTQLSFLSPVEKRRFDSPPVFTKTQRLAYFAVTEEVRTMIGGMRSATNKVGFLLQLGYFKHSGKFFEKSAFRPRDIKCVNQLLNKNVAIDLV